MLKKKIIFILAVTFIITSCSDSWDSVKRGLTGAKSKSTDEFLIKKKDPLILPPDFENLPSPDDRMIAKEEISIFEKKLKKESLIEDASSTAGSVEESILEQIKKN